MKLIAIALSILLIISCNEASKKLSGENGFSAEEDSIIFIHRDGRLWGFMNAAGDTIIKPTFTNIFNFINGRALARITDNNSQELYGVINKKGKWVIEPTLYLNDANGIADSILFVKDIKLGKWRFLDKTYNFINVAMYDEVYDMEFTNGNTVVGVKGKWGIVNKKAEWILPAKFDKIFTLSSSPIRAVLNNKTGYINMEGQEVIPFMFEEGTDFKYSAAFVRVKNKYGLIDKKGKWLLPAEVEQFEFKNNSNGIVPYFIVSKAGKWGVIDSIGNYILQPMLDKIETFDMDSNGKVTNIYGTLNNKNGYVKDGKFKKSIHRNYYSGTVGKQDAFLELRVSNGGYQGHCIFANDTILYHISGMIGMNNQTTLFLSPDYYRKDKYLKAQFGDDFSKITGRYYDESINKNVPFEFHLSVKVEREKISNYNIEADKVEMYLSNSLVSRKAQANIQSIINKWVESCKTEINESSEPFRYDLGVYFSLHYLTKSAFSYSLNFDQYWGGAHGWTTYTFKNYIIKENDLVEVNEENTFKENVKLDSLFYCPDNHKVYYGSEQMDKDAVEKEFCFNFGNERIGKGIYFTLGNGNLQLSFDDDNSILEREMFIENNTIPFEKLKPYLNSVVYESFRKGR